MAYPIYTLVDDTHYEVQIFRSLRALETAIKNEILPLGAAEVGGEEVGYSLRPASFDLECFPEGDVGIPVTTKNISTSIKENGSAKLYPLDGGDWKYKIQKHL